MASMVSLSAVQMSTLNDAALGTSWYLRASPTASGGSLCERELATSSLHGGSCTSQDAITVLQLG